MTAVPTDEAPVRDSGFDRTVAQRWEAIRAGNDPWARSPSLRWLADWTEKPAAERLPPRLRPGAGPRLASARTGTSPYVPFAAGEAPQRRLEIRCATGMLHSISYDHIGVITYDFGSPHPHVIVPTRHLLVLVWGKGLYPIAEGLGRHVCRFIAEYDPARFAPAAAAETLVEEIEVYRFPAEEQ